MPEYLAPGVYVEEIDTGTKPIEGVSTSTAGMLGVTLFGIFLTPVFYYVIQYFKELRGESRTEQTGNKQPALELHAIEH